LCDDKEDNPAKMDYCRHDDLSICRLTCHDVNYDYKQSWETQINGLPVFREEASIKKIKC
jgi:hypothetical protein